MQRDKRIYIYKCVALFGDQRFIFVMDCSSPYNDFGESFLGFLASPASSAMATNMYEMRTMFATTAARAPEKVVLPWKTVFRERKKEPMGTTTMAAVKPSSLTTTCLRGEGSQSGEEAFCDVR